MVDELYLGLLKSRLNYFADKSIVELTDEEIKEFQNLKLEVAEQMGEITKRMMEIMEPMREVFQKYNDGVVNK